MNNEPNEDSRSVLAQYFLANFSNLDKLNVYDLAEDCGTTRASVRRFCQSLGYDNFLDIKNEFAEYTGESSHYYRKNEDAEDAMQRLSDQIFEMTQDINRSLRLWIREFSEQVEKARQIVFLISDIYTRQCIEFQKEMLLSGKMTRIVDKKYLDSGLLKQLKPEDLLITISVGGFFAKETEKLVEKIQSEKVLITSNHRADLQRKYDKVYYLSEKELGRERTAYHMFGVEYALELIYLEYDKKFLQGNRGDF